MWYLIESEGLRQKVIAEVVSNLKSGLRTVKIVTGIVVLVLCALISVPVLLSSIADGGVTLSTVSSAFMPCILFGGVFTIALVFLSKTTKNTIEMWQSCPLYFTTGTVLRRRSSGSKSKIHWYDIQSGDIVYECRNLIGKHVFTVNGRPCVMIAPGVDNVEDVDRYNSNIYGFLLDDYFTNDFDIPNH